MTRFAAIFLLLALPLRADNNLVPNSGFELGRKWIYYGNTGSGVIASGGELQSPWTATTGVGHSGSNSFRMTEGAFLYSQNLYLTSSITYKLSAWMKAEVALNNSFVWGISAHSDTGEYRRLTNMVSTSDAFIDLTTSWVRYTNSFTPFSNGWYMVGFCMWQNGLNGHFPLIDDVMLEAGSTLNDWEPMDDIEVGLVLTNYGGLLMSEQTKQVPLRFFNNTANASNVVYEVNFYDDYNRTLKSVTANHSAASGRSEVNITLPNTNGYMRVVYRTDRPNSLEDAQLTVVPFSSSYSTNLGTNAIVANHVHSGVYSSQKYALLSPWSRNLMALRQMRWTTIEPTEGNWVWADDEIDHQTTNGLVIFGCLAAGLDGVYPAWADAGGVMDVVKFTNYVSTVVGRYNTKIRHWEVLNEPNNYDGMDEEQYAELLHWSVIAITNQQPDAYIVAIAGVGQAGSGAATWASNVFTHLPAWVRARINAVSAHLYPGSNPPNTSDRVDDHWAWFGQWATWLAAERATNPTLEMWNSEWGQYWGGALYGRTTLWPGKYSTHQTYTHEVTRGEVEYRVRKSIDSGAANFLRAIGWWGKARSIYYDGRLWGSDNHKSTGNTSDEYDDTIRPTYAVQAFAAWLLDQGVGLGAVTNLESNGLEAYLFQGRDGRSVLAAWSVDNLLRTITVTNGAFALYDHWANKLQTNVTTVELTRTPRIWVSNTLATNQIRDTYIHADIVSTNLAGAPQVVIDIAPTGSYATGDYNLAKWSTISPQFVPYDATASERTNIVYRWNIDGGSWSAYSQSNHTWLDLDEGDFTLTVQAVDQNGESTTTTYQSLLSVPATGGVTVGTLTVEGNLTVEGTP